MTDEPQIQHNPQAIATIALALLEEGIGLDRARHSLKMEVVHGAKETNESLFLGMAIKIITDKRDKKIDDALLHWQMYRKMR